MMKILIVEDDLTSRMLLLELLRKYGQSHVAINGKEASEAVRISLEQDEPYDLICLDIMMPEVDGHEALKRIRKMEEDKGISSSKGAKIVMTTALADLKNVSESYKNLCDGYLTKPIEGKKLIAELKKLNLIDPTLVQ